MGKIAAMTGNTAAYTGAALCRPDLIAAYPITPQLMHFSLSMTGRTMRHAAVSRIYMPSLPSGVTNLVSFTVTPPFS